MKNKLSVVISAYNEGTKLERCLRAVAWSSEIIVVDNESTDETAAIARKFTKYVYSRPNNLMLNRNKNFGFEKATGTWILNLDADEVVPAELKDEILRIMDNEPGSGNQKPEINGYWISRKNIIFGTWISHGFWWPDRQLRLFRKGKGAFPCRYIHEYIKVDGPSAELTHPYTHYNYESVSQYIQKLDRCTTSEASELLADGYEFRALDAVRFPVRDFLKVYFSQKAYKDGVHGLVLSLLQAFYAFVIFAKLWEIRKFPEAVISSRSLKSALHRSARELRYWQLTKTIGETNNPFMRLFYKIQRRFARA